MNVIHHLKDLGQMSLPRGHRSELRLQLIVHIHIQLASPTIDVDLVQPEPTLALPRVADDVEDDDNWHRQIELEEGVGIKGLDGGVKLAGESQRARM